MIQINFLKNNRCDILCTCICEPGYPRTFYKSRFVKACGTTNML